MRILGLWEEREEEEEEEVVEETDVKVCGEDPAEERMQTCRTV